MFVDDYLDKLAEEGPNPWAVAGATGLGAYIGHRRGTTKAADKVNLGRKSSAIKRLFMGKKTRAKAVASIRRGGRTGAIVGGALGLGAVLGAHKLTQPKQELGYYQ